MTFSIIIPSISAETLRITLDSIKNQELMRGDQVLVVGDNHQPRAEEIVEEYDPQYFQYIEYKGESCWGNPNRNFAFDYCTADYISFMDEDDIYYENAFSRMRRWISLQPGKLFMFRFKHQVGGTLWHTPNLLVGGSVGGHCIVPPNNKEKLGRWTMDYCGDFDFIKSTIDLYDQSDLFWVDEVISCCRPRKEEIWWN